MYNYMYIVHWSVYYDYLVCHFLKLSIATILYGPIGGPNRGVLLYYAYCYQLHILLYYAYTSDCTTLTHHRWKQFHSVSINW